MSGLFARLEARLGAPEALGLAPRVRSRFEDGPQDDGLSEWLEERPAPRPERAPFRRAPLPAPTLQRAAERADITRPAPATEPPADPGRAAAPLQERDNRAQHERGPPRAAADPRGRRANPVAPLPEGRSPKALSEPPGPEAPQSVAREVELRRIETRVIKTRAPDAPPETPTERRGQAEASALAAPADPPRAPPPEPALASPAPASTTVRIGRIEVSAPPREAPKPAPAPAAPRPKAPRPPRGTPLTDYLGWRR